jgi:putative transposase
LTKRREKAALAVETHESWLEANCSLNMGDLREQKKLMLEAAA